MFKPQTKRALKAIGLPVAAIAAIAGVWIDRKTGFISSIVNRIPF